MDSSTPRPPVWWQRRGLWLVLLLVCAAVYYGSYYRYGINFRDEGGTTTLNGQRLLEGQVPFRDVSLGYNVGWFAPIVALFKITGVNFVAARTFFLLLATLTAVMAFLTVERAARYAKRSKLAAPLGFLVAFFVLLVPGMIFKNYNPLAVVTNAWCLLGFILADEFRQANWRALLGGLALGATWLLRLDLGIFFTFLWLGVLVARLPGPRAHLAARAASSGLALVILIGSFALLHAPFLWDAQRRHYTQDFLAAYGNQWRDIVRTLPGMGSKATPKTAGAMPATSGVGADPTSPAPTPVKAVGTWKKGTQSRISWGTVASTPAKRYPDALGLFLLTYFPLLVLLPMVICSGISWARAAFSGGDSRLPLASLTVLGSALTLFPQFFIWRPDAAHLSEFGPGYWTATVCALLLSTGKKQRIWLWFFGTLLLVQAGIWSWRMFPDRWCGSIAARWNRDVLFKAENGVSVYEQDNAVPWMNEMLQLIQTHSRPGEYLVAYPYHPTFNVIANRPTYEKNVYIDNAEAKPDWSKRAIERVKKYHPAIIIMGDWDINNTEESRFGNWAAPFCAFVRENYELLGTFDKKEKFQLFARKTSASATPVAPIAEEPPGAPPSLVPANPLAAGGTAVDDALAIAKEAAQPFQKEGFEVRGDYWGGDMAVKQSRPITHQLFKGNEYWFWVGTLENDAKTTVHIYDGDGNLCEDKYQEAPHQAMARVTPQRTGTYYLIVEVQQSDRERTHWGMAYGYRAKEGAPATPENPPPKVP